MEYVKEIDHPTSVQKIQLLKEPTPYENGFADMTAQEVFSVFDYGTIKPSVPLDNSTITLMGVYNDSLLVEEGLPTHMLGLVNKGELISAEEAIDSRIFSSTKRVEFVNKVVPRFDNGGWDYSMFHEPAVNNYVQPIEFISRNEMPPESSVWGRIERGEVTLEDFGLPSDFKKGDPVPEDLKPILDYSTKFEPDDRYLRPEVARQLMGISEDRFEQINSITRKASNIMTDYAASRGFKRLDGKVEYAVLSERMASMVQYLNEGKTPVYIASFRLFDVLADQVCTWHEDRIEWKGLGISKQRIRNKVKKLNPQWYEEIKRCKEKSKEEGIEDFRTLMDPDIKYVSPNPEFFEAVNTLFRAGTNQWIGRKYYDVYPGKDETLEDNLDRAQEEFKKVA